MFRNYLKSAYRNLLKTRLFSFINIMGLAVGMAAGLLILHYVTFEKSYDNFHQASDRVYRLRYERIGVDGSGAVRFASCCPPAGKLIRERYSQVENLGRMLKYAAAVSYQDRRFIENRMFFAEPELLEVLQFEFLSGDPMAGISQPNKAFMSESTARKYFGDEDPLGKVFSVDQKTDYEVSGVFRDLPANSHLKADILLAWENLVSLYGAEFQDAWGHTGVYTYLRLKPGTDLPAFETQLAELVETEFGEALKHYNLVMNLPLQPLRDIHLTSHFMQEYELNGDRDTVNFLLIIAVFIIIMAWVNYVNLSTARTLTRAREVGLRKVAGATRAQLMGQFFLETLLINLAALILAFGLIALALPLFHMLTGIPPSHTIWVQGWFGPAIMILLAAGILLSGLYPVMVMSSFQPAAVLKGKLGGAGSGINLRKALVVFQFVIALVLLSGTFTVYHQLAFMQQHDLGFDIDQSLVIKAPRVRDEFYSDKFGAFKKTLLGHSAIKNISHATDVPGRQIWWDAGAIHQEGEDASKGKNYQIVGIDADYIELFDLKLAAGRNFSPDAPADKEALILNETAVRWMGFDSPEDAVGGRVDYWGNIFTIVGVLQDYHQQSLKAEFEPHLYRYLPTGRDVRGVFAVKLAGKDIPAAVALIKSRYDEFFPGNPFDYFFLDAYYDQQYHSDRLFGQVFTLFAGLAIFITALGIFGLSAFSATQRTREIGIRKVLGADISRIVLLLSRDVLILLALSCIIALPLLWLGLNGWLEGFATRMALRSELFIVPMLIVAGVTLLTVGYQTVKAARGNPVEALKYE